MAVHEYALLVVGGLEEVAIRSLQSECGLECDMRTLPIPTLPKGMAAGPAGGVSAIMTSTEHPLPSLALSSPCLSASLAVVLECELADSADLQTIGELLRDGQGWRTALRTLNAHTKQQEVSASASFRVASLRGGKHSFGSRELNEAVADVVGVHQPSWTVDLEQPDVCIVCRLLQQSLLIGLLLPPSISRKTDPLPAEHRSWLVGAERPHMRPSRAALCVRLLSPRDGEVWLDPCGGIGLLPIEAALLARVRAFSIDTDREACDAACANIAAAGSGLRGTVEVVCADALRPADELGVPPAGVDVVVADLPFGMLYRRLDVGALLVSLAKLLKPGGRCLLMGNAGPGGVAAAVCKASGRYPKGAWTLESQTSFAAGGVACAAVLLVRS